MIEWNFDMEEAPKGNYRNVSTGVDKEGKPKFRKVYDSVRLLAADDRGEVVTITNWLPDQERWNMFTKDNPPIAWAFWPKHPLI